MPNGRTLEQAEKQLALLAEENRRLAAELESLQKQGPALEKAVSDARTTRAASDKAAAELKSRLETSEKQLAQVQGANKVLTAQVSRLGKLADKTPFNALSIEEGSALFDRVIGAFQTSKTLEVKNASLNLKLATAKLGDTAVLLLPDPKSVDPATLHEIRIDLTVAAGAGLASQLVPQSVPVAKAMARAPARAATKAPARKRP
jgi:uncharacterized protein YigA (DUF484 family)